MKQMWLVGTPLPDTFPLPHEVFELGLEQGELLVYIYLVYYKSLKHSASKLNCAAISKAVGLCEKTVKRHLHTLISKEFIRAAGCGSNFSYELCPIWDKVQEHNGGELRSQNRGGLPA